MPSQSVSGSHFFRLTVSNTVKLETQRKENTALSLQRAPWKPKRKSESRFEDGENKKF